MVIDVHDGGPTGPFFLRLGGVRARERVLAEVDRSCDSAGLPRRRITPNAAVTIASWWVDDYPALKALTEHSPTERGDLLHAIDTAIRDTTRRAGVSLAPEAHALTVLRQFVIEWDE